MNLASLLLLAVAVTHYGVDPLCALVPGLAHAAKGLFYVFRGIEGAILFGIIGVIRPILWPVCAWGLVEEGETAVCRFAAGPLGMSPTVTPWAGLCSEATHLPIYMLGIVYLAILATRKAENEPRT
jgi:hypothetical protein